MTISPWVTNLVVMTLVITAPALLERGDRANAADSSDTRDTTKPAVLYVAPNGSDANPGSEARPFQTIAKARDVVRARAADMSGDIVVVLRDGTHVLHETLSFDHRDSGRNGRRVIYRGAPGETPIVSGGKAITGWQPGTAGRWTARTDVPDFRQLYVDGRRAARARGPIPDGLKLQGNDGYLTTQGKLADWANPGEIEFCYPVVWTLTRCKVKSIRRRDAGAFIEMQKPYFEHARTKEGVRVELPAYMENALELLDEPGEWYLDRRAGVVHYMPRSGDDMKSAKVIAPAVETLVALCGTPDEPVHDIRFEGITFAHGSWLQPNKTGLVGVQANFVLEPDNHLKRKFGLTIVHNEHTKNPANIVCRAVRSVRFERCTFTKLGGAGIDLDYGAQDNAIVGCTFHDISGSAIQIGAVLKDDHHPEDPRLIVKDNRVIDNHIHHVAIEYKGGVGVFAGYTEGTVIEHNEISHLPYSGISIGWGWGEQDAGGGAAHYEQPFRYDTPTPAKNNRIAFNHIHHVMAELQDGGGIYTLGNQPGTVIRANHIHDNPGMPGGIYLDEGSGFIEVTGNVVYEVPRPMNYNNKVQDRNKTCNEHDNFFGVRSGSAAKKIIDRAGSRSTTEHEK